MFSPEEYTTDDLKEIMNDILCELFKRENGGKYYFAVDDRDEEEGENYSTPSIIIVDKEFYDENGYWDDNDEFAETNADLPIYQTQECVYERLHPDISYESIREKMIKMGMIENNNIKGV